MDLPTDVWGIILDSIAPTEWAEACYTSRASFAMGGRYGRAAQ